MTIAVDLGRKATKPTNKLRELVKDCISFSENRFCLKQTVQTLMKCCAMQPFIDGYSLSGVVEQDNLAVTFDLQQCGILTYIDSDEPVQPAYNLRNSE